MRQIWKHGCDIMKRVKCKTPLRCNPQFEGKYHCKTCAREELE